MSTATGSRLLNLFQRVITIQDDELHGKIFWELTNFRMKISYMRHASIFHGLLPWLLPFPKIQAAGYPWSYRKIEEGMLLLEELRKGKDVMNKAAETFLEQKKNLSNPTVHTEGGESAVDSVEDGAVQQTQSDGAEIMVLEQNVAVDLPDEDDDLPCTCKIKSLLDHFSNRNVAIGHLKIMQSGCRAIVEGDLHSIITNYRSIFESCIYLTKDIQMSVAADEISQIADGIAGKLDQITSQPNYGRNPAESVMANIEQLLLSHATSND